MRSVANLTFVILVATLLTGGSALANICRTDRLTCVTTMPVDGYCECTSHGATEGGTVFGRPEAHQPVNSTSGGCGAQPNAPGCR